MNSFFQIPKSQFLQLILLYTVAQGGILFLTNSIYWDDWALFGTTPNPNKILETLKQHGSFGNEFGYIYLAMVSIGYPWFYKVCTFILSFFTGVFVWKIASKQPWINQQERYFIALLFLITPCFAARVVMIDFPYLLCVFLFFGAWTVMDQFRVFSLLLFFLSFDTESLLVFYALPMLDWLCRDLSEFDLKKLSNWCISKADFLIIPFAWFSLKLIFFKPYGLYRGYNETYSLKYLLTTPLKMVFDWLMLNINLSTTILIFALLLIGNILPEAKFRSRQRNILYSGLLALFLGLFPYMILGHIPTFTEWASRHQLLMPLGLSLLSIWMISSLGNAHRKLYVAFVVAVCLSINTKNYLDFYFDWKKQLSIVQFVKNSEEVKKSSLVLVNDQTPNALQRSYRFYEWNGLLKSAFRDESRFGIDLSQMANYDAGKFDEYFLPDYSAGNHVRNKQENRIILTIEKSDNTFLRAPSYNFSVNRVVLIQ